MATHADGAAPDGPRVLRLGRLAVVWHPARPRRLRWARRLVWVAAGSAVALAAAAALRPPAPPPRGSDLAQQRAFTAVARVADPALAGLADGQLVYLGVRLCAALDAGAPAGHPTIPAEDMYRAGAFALGADAYDKATVLAAAVFCPAHLDAVRGAR